MPRRKEKLINGEYYHVILRALDNNLIFKDVNDYYRGIFSIYELNNANSVTIQKRRKSRIAFKKKLKETGGTRGTTFVEEVDQRYKLVDILAFCFMPNHVHLLVKQIKENSISKFMQKFGGGYGRYFNTKYQRKGHVFMDSFKSVHIEDDRQFIVVANYIFTNPVALIEPDWKEKGIRQNSIKKVMGFLKKYKWSSYQDCIGIKNFPSVIQKEFLMENMGGEKGCKNAVLNWLKQKKDMARFNSLFLEGG